MRVYPCGSSHLLCGYWNGSPVEIGFATLATDSRARRHYHVHAAAVASYYWLFYVAMNVLRSYSCMTLCCPIIMLSH